LWGKGNGRKRRPALGDASKENRTKEQKKKIGGRGKMWGLQKTEKNFFNLSPTGRGGVGFREKKKMLSREFMETKEKVRLQRARRQNG